MPQFGFDKPSLRDAPVMFRAQLRVTNQAQPFEIISKQQAVHGRSVTSQDIDFN
jgi:hypothetical protein